MDLKIIISNIFIICMNLILFVHSAEDNEILKTRISHTFTNETGTYDVKAIIQWASSQPIDQHVELPTNKFADFLIWDTWSELDHPPQSNLKQFVESPNHKHRVMTADLNLPIVLTNTSVIIDGVHRIAKAMYESHEKVKCVFIDHSTLIKFRISSPFKGDRSSLIPHLPIEDLFLRLGKDSLPKEESERIETLEEYFTEHLPTAMDKEDYWEVRLERPSTPYGSYMHDPQIRQGLEWWRPGTRVRNIPSEKRFLERGLFALEDQWIPLSWSHYFQRNGSFPQELILLHIDDHQDMMAPRIGKRLDGRYVDFITGDHFSLLKPETVEAAIVSGALGKGSILTPLIWQLEKIHVRHLTLRPTPYTNYALKKALQQDTILGEPLQRISIQCENTERDTLLSSSNYIATSNIDTWLSFIPDNVAIFLHIDMDFFNNRFDGDSSWQEDKGRRIHDPSLNEQQKLLKDIFAGIKRQSLHQRIIDVSICLSPSFFPAEFWEPITEMLFRECKELSILSMNDKATIK
ncbi:hypothetical protein [Candidatus Odyssella acanthamoebae]|uniref:ParB/Sulfiredoxin domain-containing protein n=1 Tax=Candidatus Odyssella acanthamoebae TaxID=91604 RepID=A0A077AW14_9PROT|nr:hypothetical protein [Candidatus Paracaedibacter acanthamoebae]AIK96244.1 hypothetical protein ID47_05035 [Candidatus Paracaedibacter acanthamoebae]